MDLVAYCLVKGMCIKHPTTFRTAPDAEPPWFLMQAEKKLLNRTYFLFDYPQARRFATITCKGKGLWRILDEADRDVCMFLDGGTRVERVCDTLFGGTPDKYTVVSGGCTVAHIGMEPRPEEEPVSGGQGLLKRIFKSLARRSDWAIALEPDSAAVDRRALLAGMILLIEHTISMANSG